MVGVLSEQHQQTRPRPRLLRPAVLMHHASLNQSSNTPEYGGGIVIAGADDEDEVGDADDTSSVSTTEEESDDSSDDEAATSPAARADGSGSSSDSDSSSSSDDSEEESDVDTDVDMSFREARVLAANIATLCRETHCARVVAASALVAHRGNLREATINVVREIIETAQGEPPARMPSVEAMTIDDSCLTQRVIDDLSMIYTTRLSSEEIQAEFRLHLGNVAMMLAARGEFMGMETAWIVFVCRCITLWVSHIQTLHDEIRDQIDTTNRVQSAFPHVPRVLVAAAYIICEGDEERMQSDLLRMDEHFNDDNGSYLENIVRGYTSVTPEQVDGDLVGVLHMMFFLGTPVTREQIVEALALVGDGGVLAALFALRAVRRLDEASGDYILSAVRACLDDVRACLDDDDDTSSSTDDDGDSTTDTDSEDDDDGGDDGSYDELSIAEEAVVEEAEAEDEDDDAVQFVLDHVPWVSRERVVEVLARFDGACDETIVELLGSRPRSEARS